MTCATRTHLAGRTSAGAPGGGAAITTKATYKKPFLSGFLWGWRVSPWAGVEEEGSTHSPIHQSGRRSTVERVGEATERCTGLSSERRGRSRGTVHSRTLISLRFL